MLRIKLLRQGRKESQTFRLIVQPDREKLNGNVVETLGYIMGDKNPKIDLDRSKLDKWLKAGAVPTLSAAKLLGLESHK